MLGRKPKYIKTIKIPSNKIIEIIESLKAENKISVTGLGVFELRNVKSRKLFHNFSGKIITIKKRTKVHFIPSLTLKDNF